MREVVWSAELGKDSNGQKLRMAAVDWHSKSFDRLFQNTTNELFFVHGLRGLH